MNLNLANKSSDKVNSALFKNPRQLSLMPAPTLECGGSFALNRRKSKRIIALKRPLHLVLKADIKFSGSLLKNKTKISHEIEKWSSRFGIKLYNQSINSDHIHLNVKLSSLENYKKFIKSLTGRLAQIFKLKFLLRPYTKVLSWGREFRNFVNYTIQNQKEALGLTPYKKRKWRRSKLETYQRDRTRKETPKPSKIFSRKDHAQASNLIHL